ncbi:hypothetical protein H0H87_012515, partial [Tephrocybe sp. NHM501043]
HRWTQTHGFFLIMGGFQVYTPSDPAMPITLTLDDIGLYMDDHGIDISEKDILDRSKGNTLTKFLMLLQVTWFILQVAT